MKPANLGWHLLGVAALMLGSLGAAGAEETLEQKRDAKLASPYFTKAAWIADYDQAREAAKTSGKLIFAYFNRSYAY